VGKRKIFMSGTTRKGGELDGPGVRRNHAAGERERCGKRQTSVSQKTGGKNLLGKRPAVY